MFKFLRLAVIGVMLANGTTYAEPDGQVTEKSIEVKPGDTLSKIAETHLGDAAKWYILLRFNDIRDPNLIYPGMKLKYSEKIKSGEIVEAEIFYATEGQAMYKWKTLEQVLKTGDRVPAKGEISVKKGTVTLLLPDKSKIIMGENSVLKIKDVFANTEENVFMSFFENVRGRIRYKITELFGESRFEVETRSAVAGVRGTEFEIFVVDGQDVKIATLEGAVAVRGNNEEKSTLVEAGEGVVVDTSAEKISRKTRLLGAPQNLGYRNNPNGTITFFWEPVQGATDYALYIAEDRDFATGVLIGEIKGNDITIRQVPEGRYYLKCDAIDPEGMSSVPGKVVLLMID